jgi:2-polyprenyl-6-hydroxyphenyl methylase/3-demethylubiquinone-9 3-methyltransferase
MLSLKWNLAQWFELRWWKNYLSGKDKQTYLQWKREYWNKLLAELAADVSINPSMQIADMGCGPAGIFIALPNNEVTAVDPLIDAYEKETNFFRKSDYPNVIFLTDTIENFSSQQTNAKYDVVFCMNAINHVNDIRGSFQNLKYLCRRTGAVVVSIDAHRFRFFKYLFRLVPGDILHPHQYDLKEYRELLAAGEWKIIACKQLKQAFFFSHYCLIAKRKI